MYYDLKRLITVVLGRKIRVLPSQVIVLPRYFHFYRFVSFLCGTSPASSFLLSASRLLLLVLVGFAKEFDSAWYDVSYHGIDIKGSKIFMLKRDKQQPSFDSLR
jgi:hypothetical protein